MKVMNEFSLPPRYVAQVGTDGRVRMEDGESLDSVAFRTVWVENELGVDHTNLAVLTVRATRWSQHLGR